MSTGERVGVIGLGNIGGAIAANLVTDGHHVSVYDRDELRTGAVVGLGARAAHGPAEVGERSEITFASLPTPAVVDEVASAWVTGAAPDSVFVDLSTNAPASHAVATSSTTAGVGNDANVISLRSPTSAGPRAARAPSPTTAPVRSSSGSYTET